MRPALQTRCLSRRFGGRVAVDNLSMTVPAGSVYGFLGRNGAGKTTTMKLLLGLLRPDAGQILVDGIDVATDRIGAARRIGAVLEAHGLYANLSGRDNLDLSRRLLGLPGTEIDRVLELTEMTEHRHRRVADYSLGMRQRLGLARALLGAPPVLLLDEPTNGLDPEGIAAMRRFLRQLPARSGATVLVSSHLLGEIEQTATHVGILSRGRLVVEGPLADLTAGLGAEIRIESDAPAKAAAIAIDHGLEVVHEDDAVVVRLPRGSDLRAIAAVLNRCLCLAGVPVHAFAPRRQSLEHLYRTAAQPVGHWGTATP
jgi:ABC-type multidrug transport system ATPase subunit